MNNIFTNFSLDVFTITYIVVCVVAAIVQLLVSRFAKNILAGFIVPLLWIIAAAIFYFAYNWRGVKIYVPLIVGLLVLFLLYALAREWRMHSEQKRKEKETRNQLETEAELEKEKARREHMEEQLEKLKEQQEEEIARLKQQQEEQLGKLEEKEQKIEEQAQQLQEARSEIYLSQAQAEAVSSQNAVHGVEDVQEQGAANVEELHSEHDCENSCACSNEQ